MRKTHAVTINAELCIGCGQCKRDCVTDDFKMEGGKAVVKGRRCIQCGHCVAICPKAAVSMSGFDEPPIPLDGQHTVNPEQLLLALQARRSIRQFKAEPVPEETVRRIIEAGRFTPSAKNKQDVSYIILNEGKAQCEKIAVQTMRNIQSVAGLFTKKLAGYTLDDQFLFKGAPLVIVVTATDQVSGALAASNMALMAESCGLGVLYSGFFAGIADRVGKLRRLLGVGRREHVVATLVMGYPDVTYRRTAQKETAIVRSL